MVGTRPACCTRSKSTVARAYLWALRDQTLVEEAASAATDGPCPSRAYPAPTVGRAGSRGAGQRRAGSARLGGSAGPRPPGPSDPAQPVPEPPEPRHLSWDSGGVALIIVSYSIVSAGA